VGLLVVCGIGEPRRGEMLGTVVDGLELAYGASAFARDDKTVTAVRKAPDSRDGKTEIRIFEVFWVEVLKPERVRGSFKVRHVQQLVWFPFLNWRRVEHFASEYGRPHVFVWMTILVPLAAAITAAYYGSLLILAGIEKIANLFCGSGFVEFSRKSYATLRYWDRC
jgi:hypothetical protein